MSKGLFNFMPARAQKDDSPPELVADLDQLEIRHLNFKLHDKVFTIGAINTATYFKLANAYAQLAALAKKETVLMPVLVAHYLQLFQAAVPALKKDDVEQMTMGQIGALSQLIMDHSYGKTADPEIVGKKKL